MEFRFGANYKFNDRLQLRGGFWYVPYVVPEANFSPAIENLSSYGVTVGTGYDITSHVTVDVAYNAIFMQTRVIQNSIGANSTASDPQANVSGTYENFVNLLVANVTYKF